jgi:hypothetical protein
MCSLTEQTFSDFLITSKEINNGKDILRLKVVPAADSETTPVPCEPFAAPWQRVEQGSDDGSDRLHTVTDLTDACMTESCGDAGYPVQEQTIDKQDSEEYHIHTPQHSPRAGASHATIAEDESKSNDIASADFEASPDVCATSGSASCVDDLVIDHADDEKIDLIIAAFDENGDGHLNFQEMNSLHNDTFGGEIAFDVFRQMCVDEGEDVEMGLGREALMCIYSRSRELEKDFDTARQKFESFTAEERQRHREAQAGPMNLLLSNPLLAVPFALDATERVRQKVVGKLKGCPSN